jgi:CelD/BcsL family acetyltransferase involved in cellulose biosynthesis
MLMRRDGQPEAGRIHIVPATLADADAAAEAADPRHAFLRGRWAEAAAPGAVTRWAAMRADGSPLAVLPLVDHKIGPVAVREVAGCYWPYRSIAVAADATGGELAAMLQDPRLRRALGPAWRLGPVFDNDPAATRLREAAAQAGWTILTRRLGTCFEIYVAALLAEGPWPRGPTMKKNRWREKQLAKSGPVELHAFSGATWSAAERDAIAAIERNSWLAKLGEEAACQFADSARRLYWESVAADPVIAGMIFGTILNVGGVPAAFSFGLQVGTTRYQIANNFDERFAEHSAGRTLLLKDFERAAAAGVRRISWGSGDAGYKSEMGAQPGPAILDLLFVRPKLLALPLSRWWGRAPS